MTLEIPDSLSVTRTLTESSPLRVVIALAGLVKITLGGVTSSTPSDVNTVAGMPLVNNALKAINDNSARLRAMTSSDVLKSGA